MAVDPLRGDIKYLRGQSGRLRRRVGNWRIFFRLLPEQRHVLVSAIERRTTTTY
jgi:mRNA-degrading endonuclease RelE of RelBE toxin-antitoxin system